MPSQSKEFTKTRGSTNVFRRTTPHKPVSSKQLRLYLETMSTHMTNNFLRDENSNIMLPLQPSHNLNYPVGNFNDLSIVISASSADGSKLSQRSNQFQKLCVENDRYGIKKHSRSFDRSIHSVNNSFC